VMRRRSHHPSRELQPATRANQRHGSYWERSSDGQVDCKATHPLLSRRRFAIELRSAHRQICSALRSLLSRRNPLLVGVNQGSPGSRAKAGRRSTSPSTSAIRLHTPPFVKGPLGVRTRDRRRASRCVLRPDRLASPHREEGRPLGMRDRGGPQGRFRGRVLDLETHTRRSRPGSGRRSLTPHSESKLSHYSTMGVSSPNGTVDWDRPRGSQAGGDGSSARPQEAPRAVAFPSASDSTRTASLTRAHNRGRGYVNGTQS